MPKFASVEIAPATDAVIVEVRMSRCFTCASSCAITPRSSRAVSTLQDAGGRGDRRVLRIAPGRERIGLRLVDQVDARHRQARALAASSRTMPWNCGALDASTSRALYMRSTILSENQ